MEFNFDEFLIVFTFLMEYIEYFLNWMVLWWYVVLIDKQWTCYFRSVYVIVFFFKCALICDCWLVL